MADIDHARNRAIRAVDALNERKESQAAEYWIGYLSAALAEVIFDLRTGA